MLRLSLAVLVSWLCFVPPVLADDSRPTLVVFDILELPWMELEKAALNRLTDHIGLRLSESGRYLLFPRDQLRKRLLVETAESRKKCYSKFCQTSIGRELGAEKILSTQIVPMGESCSVSLKLYDLKKSHNDWAVNQLSACGEQDVMASVDMMLAKVFGRDHVKVLSKSAAVKAARNSAAAKLKWVRCTPAGLEFTKSEVTLTQYRVCVEAGQCGAPKTKSDDKSCNWGYADRDSHPLNCVDWHQAKAYCEWVGGRLPTDGEWRNEASNYGSRGYPWGQEEVSCERAVWNEGDSGCGRGSTWPVCSKPLGNSANGLCDMTGNVWEWISLSDGRSRGVRGVSWNHGYENPRSFSPAESNPLYWLSQYGFRCVRWGE